MADFVDGEGFEVVASDLCPIGAEDIAGVGVENNVGAGQGFAGQSAMIGADGLFVQEPECGVGTIVSDIGIVLRREGKEIDFCPESLCGKVGIAGRQLSCEAGAGVNES